MSNKQERLSSTEINKFQYCPYAWYYEKIHGKKNLTEMTKKNYSGSQARASNFVRGNNFHKDFHKKLRLYTVLRQIFLVLIFVAIIAFAFFRWVI